MWHVRAMDESKSIRLTQTVQKGGCAAKVAASELRKILADVAFPPAPPELLIGASTFDDAAVYQTSPELALVQTLDFFTPIVDTPRLFGRIAATNALSDVYAMGGLPKTAMAILAFPTATMQPNVVADVLRGASDALRDAGTAFVGGHTIDDETLKFGLSVTGFVHPEKVWSNAGAREGDALILTKPLGTGTLTAGLKRGECTEDDIRDGLESMCRLNNIMSFLSPLHQTAIHAATDITGFGLGGHGLNMARASQVALHLDLEKLPRFKRTMEFLERGFLTKAHRSNLQYIESLTEFRQASILLRQVLVDPQTSGGLLLAVASDRAQAIVDEVSIAFPQTAIIGQVCAGHGNLVVS